MGLSSPLFLVKHLSAAGLVENLMFIRQHHTLAIHAHDFGACIRRDPRPFLKRQAKRKRRGPLLTSATTSHRCRLSARNIANG
jgi:hypothetical protein